MIENTREKRTINVTWNEGLKKGEYCLGIEAENVHASFSTHDYTHRLGNIVSFSLFSMTYDELTDLASRILSQVFEIRDREAK